MQDDGEAGEAFPDLLEDIEAELGLRPGLELVGAVAGADGDGQGIHARAGDELLDLLGAGVAAVLRADVHVVLDAGQTAELAFDDHAVVVGVFHHLAGEGDVVLEAVLAAVDHDAGEAAVDAALADLEALAVVQMDADGKAGIRLGRLDQLHQVHVLGVFSGAGGHLEDQRGTALGRGLGDALDDFHVVYVESADGVALAVRALEHSGGSYDWHLHAHPFL